MIWLTWRQFRTQAAVAAGILAVLAILFAFIGRHLAHLYAASGIAACQANRGNCTARADAFISEVNGSLINHLPLLLGTVLVAVPAIIGIFWGPPLITSELEAGTHRLAWNRSVTRTRWMSVKLTVIGLASMAVAGIFSLIVTWSASPIDKVNMNRILPTVFSERGVAPIGYAAFAVALGVAAGVLIRRTLPAMAVTLAVFTAAQFAMRAIRPHLIAPVRLISAIPAQSNIGLSVTSNGTGSMSLSGNVNLPGAWVLSNQTINAAGHSVASVPLPATGPLSVTSCGHGPLQGPSPTCFAELAKQGYRQLITYQPGNRFWAFQWEETGIFLILALALTGFSIWWIRHRMS